MKKVGLYLLMIWMIICCGLVAACKDKPQRLNTPQNLVVNGTVLSWDKVEDASGYIVYYQYKEYTVDKCSYDLVALTEPNTYTIQVLARGDGKKFEDSHFATITYTVEENEGIEPTPEVPPETELQPTENLKYTLLEDYSGYEVSRGGADLTGALVIPREYRYLPVKKVGQFSIPGTTGYVSNTKTTSIHLPDTIEEISIAAFSHFEAITEIDIPCNVKVIGEGAFMNNKQLSRVNLPEGLLEIGGALFENCSKLIDIKFPDSLQKVGRFVLEDTAWLTVQSAGLVVNNHVLLTYKGDLTGHLEIPSNIKHIAAGAFDRTNIESVTIPDGVSIGESAFSMCKNLKSVRLPLDLKVLPLHTFFGCSLLQNIEIPEGVVEIGERAFYACSSLKDIVLPSTLKTIGVSAFERSAVTSLIIPDGVEIADMVGGETLKEIVIPVSITNIRRTYSGAKNLEKIYYRGTVEEWESVVADVSLPTNATVYYYSETQPTDEGNYWHFADGKPIVW